MGMMAIVKIAMAGFQGYKAIATLKKPPAGTKTITFNATALVVWAIARWSPIPIPPEVVDMAMVPIITAVNLWLRKITDGPMGE